MQSAIIRGLWGDERAVKRRLKPPRAYAARCAEALKVIKNGDCIDHVYVFGRNNYEFIRASGYRGELTLLEECPWAAPRYRDQVGQSGGGQIMWGCSHWWHKLKIWERAIDDYEQFIWLDFDLVQVRELPEDLWPRLASGNQFRACLAVHRTWGFAAPWRHSASLIKTSGTRLVSGNSEFAARIMPLGQCIYIRSKQDVLDLLALQEQHRRLYDQQLMALMFDQRNDGYLPPEVWRERGHEMFGLGSSQRLWPEREEEIIWKVAS